MSGRLDLSINDDADDRIVAIDGELDLTTTDQLAEVVGPSLEDGKDVVLDCGGLTFIDSTGLSLLVELHERASAAGRRFSVDAVPDHARRLMEITKIDELLGL